jgi:hypothetical protein
VQAGKLFLPDGSIKDVQSAGAKFTIEELQKLVGGYVEKIRCQGRLLILCDEDGLMKQLLTNPRATEEALKCGARLTVYLVGPVLFI